MAYTISDFYVGQLVRIREWEDMKAEFGVEESGDIDTGINNYHFPEPCKIYCGTVSTIEEIRDDGSIVLEDSELPIVVFASELEPVEECQTVPFDEQLFYQMVIGKSEKLDLFSS